MIANGWKSWRAAMAFGLSAAVLGFVPAARAAESSIARLSQQVQRAEDYRAVKALQMTYAQYSQAALWGEMGALFAAKGEAIYGADRATGPANITALYFSEWGGGRYGLKAGQLHTQLIDDAVVILSPDGRTARGRWYQFSLLGQYGGEASWACGILENDFVKEGGVWKIARLHYYPITAGAFETGWKSVGPTVETVPHRFTADEAGTPIPLAQDAAPALKGAPAAVLARLDRRVRRMRDEDAVLNLQNAYGYYIDRKMWDDAADLFTDDAVLEEADAGVWDGRSSIRRSYERFGPQGLKRGELNNRLLFNETVQLSRGGTTARVRGTQFDLLGDVDKGSAAWGLDVFENRLVKGADGKWRISEMRVFPIMATDYYKGWHKDRIVTPPVTGASTPDRPTPVVDQGALTEGAIPVIYAPNPATGRPIAMPASARTVGAGSLKPVQPGGWKAQPLPASLPAAEAEAKVRRGLDQEMAYLGADNIGHALGFDIDDQQWHDLGQLMAPDGWRSKAAVAFCVGPQHTEACETNYDGVAALPRVFRTTHWLIQPVIDVADDGKSARMRNYLLHLDSSIDYGVGVYDGLYPNNAAKLVDGVWKFDVAAPDQPFVESRSYAAGWARTTGEPLKVPAIKQAVEPVRDFPPDIPRASLPVRHHGSIPPNDVIRWPDIKPVWFAYKNPVSGRVPPLYCPDLKTCEKALEAGKTP